MEMMWNTMMFFFCLFGGDGFGMGCHEGWYYGRMVGMG